MEAITDNKGHDGKPVRHGDAQAKEMCARYRELLNEIYKDTHRKAKENSK